MFEMLNGLYQPAKSFLSRRQVSYLILYVTNRCNFRCNFCFYHAEVEKGRKADELSLDEILRLSETLGPLVQLSLTGGEPFLRTDLAEITGIFVKKNFVKYITVPTNASLTDALVRYLERVLPQYPYTYFRIPFSIDGVGEAHDRNRSFPGSYRKIRESYKAVSPLRRAYRNLVLDSNTVFTAQTQDTIMDTIRTLNEEFDFDNISVTYARGDVKDMELKKTVFDKYIELNSYLESLKRKKEKRFLYPFWRAVRDISREYLVRTVMYDEFITPCTAGRKLLIVSETGEVHPCEILQKSMGNLKDHEFDIKKLLLKRKNRELLNWIGKSRCKCTFECALAANVLWGKASFSKLLRSTLKNIGRN